MIKIANTQDIPEGGKTVVQLPRGQELVLFKVQGEIFALNNACPHMGGPLNEGEIEGNCVTCPWHGWQFDIKTGECVNMPGDDAEHIPVVIKDDGVYLEAKES